ncbi:hypothetical protein C8F01DRAFT_158678 [Mycena amicta]|nr:hypothetical protein C8F01DRAFT_158678 [Mycena amicta]
MPLVAAALTFGSFGDILEAAKIAKRIIDVLRKGGGSHERQKLISTLKSICDDMAGLTVLPEGYFTTRLWEEVALCRSLLDQFYAEIKSYVGVLGWVRMVASEERELASWRAQISERRAALLHLLGSINSVQVHDVGERVGRVGSQVQYLGYKVENVEAQVRNVGNEVGTLGVRITNILSAEVSRIGSEIRQVGMDIHTVQHSILKMSPHDISDPVFFIRDPLGRPITVQLSFCDAFDDLDRLLRAYLFNRPDAGSRYVERGDYSIVSTDGVIIPRLRLRGKLGAGMVFDMSIIQRRRWGPLSQEFCPHCSHTNANAVEGTWVDCSNPTCGSRYQLSKSKSKDIEDIFSPQTSQQGLAKSSWEEDWAQSFHLMQIFYEVSFALV